MTKEELFQKIEVLLEVLKEYNKTRVIDLKTTDNVQMLKDVFTAVMQRNVPMDLTCPSCVSTYLNIIQAYYDREYPSYFKTLKVSNEEPTKEIDQVVEKPKRTKKNGRKV